MCFRLRESRSLRGKMEDASTGESDREDIMADEEKGRNGAVREAGRRSLDQAGESSASPLEESPPSRIHFLPPRPKMPSFPCQCP